MNKDVKTSTHQPGRQYDMTMETSRRDAMVTIIGIMTICVLIGVATASWLKGEVTIAVMDFCAGLFISAILVLFRCNVYKQACCYIGVVMMYSLFIYLFFTGAAEGTTFMWHYTFPFFAIFLIGASHGAIATIFLFLPVFIYVVHDALTPYADLYSSHFAIRFIPSVSVALVFAYLFEKERERFRQQTITAYRQQEKIIQERTSQLEKKIAERNRMASQLRQSQKMEAIGTMAGGVAHDLNNILAGIVTYPELIRLDLPLGSELEGPMRKIEEAGKRAAAVVDDLLTLARNAASVKEPSDLNHLIRDLLISPEWSIVADQNPRVDILIDLNADQATVSCSQVHIRKCLMNLLLNAVEATTPAGNVTVATRNSIRSGSSPGEYGTAGNLRQIVITISDNGPGIGDEHIEHIFEPFYTTKKMGKSGSGLGLSVVWSTVQEHDGILTVDNTGAGAIFEMSFPVIPEPSRGALSVERGQENGDWEAYKGEGAILVVDDEPQLREIASRIVTILGYSVTSVESGEEALAHLQEYHADLVLLDMILGEGIGGYETYQKMKEHNPLQKAIIVSGYSTSEDVQKTLDLGASALVKKPYDIEDIGKAIKESLATSV